MAASCEHSYESWGSVKCVEILNYATNIRFSRGVSVSVFLSSLSVLWTELPCEVYCETKPLNHLTAKKGGETLPLLTCVREVCLSNPYGGFRDFPQSLHINMLEYHD